MTQLEVIKDFYETFSNDLDNFIEYLPIIVPDDEEDRKILMVALDMMKSIRKDLKNASSVSEVSDTIDVHALMEEWGSVKLSVKNESRHKTAKDTIDRVVEGFYKA